MMPDWAFQGYTRLLVLPSTKFTAMQLTVLGGKFPFFAGRPVYHDELAVLLDRHIAVFQDLKRSVHRAHMVEPCRLWLLRQVEIGVINEVAHQQALDAKTLLLDGIAYFIGVECPLGDLAPEIISRVDQHLRKLLRGGGPFLVRVSMHCFI